MARGETQDCAKTYGFPIYCAAWVPFSQIAEKLKKKDHDDSSSSSSSDRMLVALGGGGGAGNSGVPNALAVCEFRVSSRSLSDQPVFRLGTESELPYRMTVHPNGDGIICSFPDTSCRLYKWELTEDEENINNIQLIPAEEELTQFENIGLQLGLCFNAEGSVLATGGEDGNLRVFKWPDMESILTEFVENTSIKDLDFSSDGKYLVSLRNSGPCKIWDLNSSNIAANLARESGENFAYCRFSRNSPVLFIAAVQNGHGKIITWNTSTWERIKSKKVVRDPISAFNASPDGKFLALGTIEGNIVILSSETLQVHSIIKKAHMGILTTVAFSHDSRQLLSSSFDSTARVTTIEAKKNNGLSMWLVFLVVILAILAYYMQSKGLFLHLQP
ncbi:hypothetical protein LUZ60_011307 [Juncus effusus]|nr:hypothetical protein LUZ60_011307 [Juncus effusus]